MSNSMRRRLSRALALLHARRELLVGQVLPRAEFGRALLRDTAHVVRRPDSLEIGITGDGTVVLFAGAVDIGQGSNTILAQIAADALGVPVRQVHLVAGDLREKKAGILPYLTLVGGLIVVLVSNWIFVF